MKKIFNIISLLAVSVAILSGCKDELVDTNQYADAGVALNVYGPQPVMRGGELRFLGSNLDKITEVIIPGVSPITEINVVKAGVPSEIRIIVPKDGPEPGVVTLVAADGKEIVTKTSLTYLEPIDLESFSPASVKADDVLTIKGDYLNLIHEVVFSDEVIVSEKDFTSHTRYEIKVRVPVEARTGVIGVGDIDETLEENAELIPNIIYSEDELTVAQPEVTSMTATRFIANASVKISGRNLNYVATLNLPGAPATEFTVNGAGTEIVFNLPAVAQDGTAVLVAKSGVEVEAGNYVTVVPTSLSASPSPVKAGSVLTIMGNDLGLVTGIDLPGAAGVEFEAASDITLTMPDTATEGDATLNMANGKSVTVAFTLVKPEFASFSENPAAAGSNIVIKGLNLDLVKSVTFGGNLTVEVEATETEITVVVPTTAETGMVKLNLANGTSVDCESLTVNKPTACFITELPSAETEIYGGTVLVVPVENEDKLESVEVNGESVKFLLNGKTLYISLPDMAGKGTVVKLISSNGAVEYTIDCIPNNIQKKVIWSGSWDCGSWSGLQDLSWGGYDWSSVDLSAGTVTMIFDFTQDSSQGWWQIALRHGNGW
ncbi:MAG: IPT/TIG domain-containing protein, partial [Candidatus Cryptobacteroides sp.]